MTISKVTSGHFIYHLLICPAPAAGLELYKVKIGASGLEVLSRDVLDHPFSRLLLAELDNWYSKPMET